MPRLSKVALIVLALPTLALSGCNSGEEEEAVPAASAPAQVEPTSTPVQDEGEQVDYVASFNEPFMRFESEGDDLVYSWPQDIEGSEIDAERTRDGDVVRFTGEYHRGPFTLEIERGQCFDSMSGAEFSHQASFTGDGYDALQGCARLASEPAPRP